MTIIVKSKSFSLKILSECSVYIERYVRFIKRSYYHHLQCDVHKCPVCRYGLTCTRYKFDSCDHISMMTQYVLIPAIRGVASKFPNWLPEQHIQGTLDTASKVS